MTNDSKETLKHPAHTITNENPRLTFLKRKFFVRIFLACVTIVLMLFAISSFLILPMEKYVLETSSNVAAPVGIVFGAGITSDGKPRPVLQARLDSGADALLRGDVKILLLSGDNRFLNYNEPEAMKRYLIEERDIDEKDLQVDYAGRSTYETCERAKKVFSVDKAILFSARSHLPRAIYTCRHFGIESYGVGNNREANNAGRREPLARVKAIFNVYIRGEETILGEKIPLNI